MVGGNGGGFEGVGGKGKGKCKGKASKPSSHVDNCADLFLLGCWGESKAAY